MNNTDKAFDEILKMIKRNSSDLEINIDSYIVGLIEGIILKDNFLAEDKVNYIQMVYRARHTVWNEIQRPNQFN